MIFCNLWKVWVIAHRESSDKTPRVKTEGCEGKLPSWTGRAAINLSLEWLQKMEDKMNSGERQSCQNQPRTINPAHSKPGHCHKQIKMWQKKALYQISICDVGEAANREIDLYLAWLKDCRCQVSALQTTRCRPVWHMTTSPDLLVSKG